MSNNIVRQDNRDTFFRGLFGQSEHFVDLYEECSGKRLKPEDFRRIDINPSERVFPVLKGNGLSNDVAQLTTDNKLIILTEHTSTPNPNMGQRDLIYYAALLYQWLVNAGIELSQSSPIQVPMPEFYVVYNGKRKYSESKLNFENDFIKVSPKLVNIHFDKIKNQNPDNSLAGYSYFYKHYDAARATGASIDKAFECAVQQCSKAGYLANVIDKEDFMSVYTPLFSYEDDLRAEGRIEGRTEGELKKASDTALEMFKDGLETAKIAQYTKMPIEWVEDLLAKA